MSPNTSMKFLNIKMSAGTLSKLQGYPVFNMANEQVKDKTGADVLLNAVYKSFEDIVRYNNSGNTVIHREIVLTGNASTSKTTYKRKKPPGSPSHVVTKKRSSNNKEDMERVEESAV